MRVFQFRYLFIFLVLCAFVIIAYKAYILSFTHDEALSYFLSKNINFILNNSSNIHYINSLWLFMGQNISKNELWLRLPNVFSFILSAFAVYNLIQKREKSPFILKIFLILFVFNPLQIEFFSLARGYGLSNAFLLCALCYLTELPENTTNFQSFYKNFVNYSVFALLALYSNFTVLNFVLLGLSMYAYFYRKYYRYHIIDKRQKVKIYLLSIFLFFALYRVFALKKAKELYYGTDTLIEGVYLSVRSMTYSNSIILCYTVTCFLCLFFVLFVLYGFNSKKREINDTRIVLFLLSASVVLILIQGLVFKNKYFADRTALPYFLVFGIVFYLISYEVYEWIDRKKIIHRIITTTFIFLLSVMLAYNHVRYFSLNKTKLWAYDYHTKTVMQRIKNRIEFSDSTPNTISNHWLFTFAINFYIEKYKLDIPLTDKSGIKEGTTYIYTYNKYEPTTYKYNLIADFSDICTILLVRNNSNDVKF